MKKGCLLIFIMVSILGFGSSLFSMEDSSVVVRLTRPAKKEIIAKKPLIECEISPDFKPDSLFVTLDGTDITSLLKITSKGFIYHPVQVLMSGEHSLDVSGVTKDGRKFEKQFNFSTRHHRVFSEAYVNNVLDTNYEVVLKKPDDAEIPDSKIESNLQSQGLLKSDNWEFSFNSSLRHLDQNRPLDPPLKKGIDLVNFLFKSAYHENGLKFDLELGDIQIDETPNTVQGLGRRGGKFVLGSDVFDVKGFLVKSEQSYGFQGGVGLSGKKSDHIMGLSGGTKLFSDKVVFRVIYSEGGEKESSFGTWSSDVRKEGEVVGLFLGTYFMDKQVGWEAEYDMSKYDSDTSDEFGAKRDKAYNIRFFTNLEKYTFDFVYEYMGPEYQVVGNQGLSKDREGFSIKNEWRLVPTQTVGLSFSVHNDNVTDNDLFPKVYTYELGVDYSFNKFPSLPISLSYQKVINKSSKEPDPTYKVHTETDNFSGNVSYTKGNWNLSFQGNYSFQNDLINKDNDTTNITFGFVPSYGIEAISVSPGFNFNRSIYHLTDVRTDTYTFNLDLRGRLFKKLVYELSWTYNRTKADDDSVDQYDSSGNFRIGYTLGENLWGFCTPVVAIKGSYSRSVDKVYDSQNEEFILMAVISTNLKWSF